MKRIAAGMIVLFLIAASALAQSDPILKLKEEIIALQNQGDLGFRNFNFCSDIEGFGSYLPLPQAVIPKDGKILVYYEPMNVATNKSGAAYEIWFTQDLALLDAAGGVIQEWKDFLEFRRSSKMPMLDIFAQNSVNIEGLPAGSYQLKAVLKDQFKKKAVTKVFDFSVK